MRDYVMWKNNVGYTEFRVQSSGDYEITGYAWIAVRDSYRLCYKRIIDAIEADEIYRRLERKGYVMSFIV